MSTANPFGHRARPRGQARREAVAWHEVGHAVTAVQLGMQDVYIDLAPDPADDASAATHYRVPERWGESNARQRELAVLYAGRLGEIRRYGAAQLVGGSSGDGRQAGELLKGRVLLRRDVPRPGRLGQDLALPDARPGIASVPPPSHIAAAGEGPAANAASPCQQSTPGAPTDARPRFRRAGLLPQVQLLSA
jgi:hypothetical protein